MERTARLTRNRTGHTRPERNFAMKDFANSAAASELTMTKKLSNDDAPALTVTITYPEFSEIPETAKKRLNRFYRQAAFEYMHRCEKDLFPEAAQYVNEAAENGMSYRPWNAVMTSSVTFNSGGVLSARRDIAETIPGGRVMRLRFGDTWDLNTGFPLAADAFYPKRAKVKKQLRAFTVDSAEKLLSPGGGRLKQSVKRLIRKNFDIENFHLGGGGLEIFYQDDAIEQAEGGAAFVLPWGESGPFLPA